MAAPYPTSQHGIALCGIWYRRPMQRAWRSRAEQKVNQNRIQNLTRFPTATIHIYQLHHTPKMQNLPDDRVPTLSLAQQSCDRVVSVREPLFALGRDPRRQRGTSRAHCKAAHGILMDVVLEGRSPKSRTTVALCFLDPPGTLVKCEAIYPV
jgi:hypothetical protein